MARKVELIPASAKSAAAVTKKRRVAAYARVSTEFEQQQNSFAAQVSYYEKYIESRDDWEFVKVYADEGKSGTEIRSRQGFRAMVADALAGTFDLLITKSVSRFARNTVDSLTTIRALKEAGVEVYFEKENIRTFDDGGELLITLMASLAEQESRSISQNIRWGRRRNFAEGVVKFNWEGIFGFRSDGGEPVIIHSEAKYIMEMFDLFLRGFTYVEIAKIFTARGIPTVKGSGVWNQCTIRTMLQNEKYAGNVRLQKNFVPDFLTKRRKKNEGELPQYFVENNHEAIVPREIFDLAQAERRRRELFREKYGTAAMFSGDIRCGCCGRTYRAEVYHEGGELIGHAFGCGYINEKGERCPAPTVCDGEIEAAFVRAVNVFVKKWRDNSGHHRKNGGHDREKKAREMREIREEMDAFGGGIEGYNLLIERYARAEREHEKMTRELDAYNKRCREERRIRSFVGKLPDTLDEFQPPVWTALLDTVTMYPGEMRFLFKDGTEVTERIDI